MKLFNVLHSRVIIISLMFIDSLALGCTERPKISFTTEYQAVFLDNGQAFIGMMEKAGSHYPVLKDVFYIQRQEDPKTKEVRSILVKRGSEWHGPDQMYINASHIVFIETVSPDSRVAKLITGAKGQKEENKKLN